MVFASCIKNCWPASRSVIDHDTMPTSRQLGPRPSVRNHWRPLLTSPSRTIGAVCHVPECSARTVGSRTSATTPGNHRATGAARLAATGPQVAAISRLGSVTTSRCPGQQSWRPSTKDQRGLETTDSSARTVQEQDATTDRALLRPGEACFKPAASVLTRTCRKPVKRSRMLSGTGCAYQLWTEHGTLSLD